MIVTSFYINFFLLCSSLSLSLQTIFLTGFYFIFFSKYTVQLIQVEGNCTKILGSCADVNCPYTCTRIYEKHARVLGSSCAFYNLCTCTLDKSPPNDTPKQCSIGLGLCNSTCNDDCCNAKCVKKYNSPDGAGACLKIDGQNYCLCLYNS